MKNIIRLKKNLFSITLVFILTVSLISIPVKASNGDSLLIDGEDIITKTDHKIEYANGGYAKFDKINKTLELNNVNIQCKTNKGISGTIQGTLTIKIKGINTITINQPNTERYGIDITTDTLNIIGTKDKTSKLNINIENSLEPFYGIRALNTNLNIKDTYLDIKGIGEFQYGYTYGIYTDYKDLNINNSNINIENIMNNIILYKVKTNIDSSNLSFNKSYYNIMSTDGYITFNNSIISSKDNIAFGRLLHGTDLNINNTIINALDNSLSSGISSYNLDINNGSIIKLNTKGEGVSSYDTMIIRDSDLNVVTTDFDNGAISTGGTLEIIDSIIEASSNDYAAIYSRKVINEGDPTPTNIFLNSNITTKGNLKIVNNSTPSCDVYYTYFIGSNESITNEGTRDGSSKISIYIKDADYSAVDTLINSIPKDLSIYTDDSVKSLSTAKKDVIRDKNITEQLIVDKYATNIQIAINNLKLVPVVPNIIDGNNQTIKQGNNAVFKSNANINDFIKVSIDGKDIDSTNYTVISGSTIITLNKNYLATLSAGNHNISIVSKTGIATTNFIIKKNSKPVVPNTGITNNSYMLISIIVLILVIFIKKIRLN